jgi:hypothetical protein
LSATLCAAGEVVIIAMDDNCTHVVHIGVATVP